MNATSFFVDNLVPITAFLWIFPLSAGVLNLFVYLGIRKMKVFPAAVLLQLKHLTIVIGLSCIVNVVLYALPLLINLLHGFSPINPYRCAFWASPGNTMSSVVSSSFAFLALERWNVTRHEIQAANQGSYFSVKKILLIIWVLGVATGIILSASQIPAEMSQVFCGFLTMKVSKGLVYFIGVVLVGTETAMAVIYISVYLKNRKKLDAFSLTTTSYSVVERYQMRQTLKSFKMVAPSLVVNTVTELLIVLFLIILLNKGEQDLESQLQVGLILPLLRPFSQILHPISLVWADQDLRRYIKSIFCWCKPSNKLYIINTITVTYTVSPNTQAELLDSFWDRNQNNQIVIVNHI